VRIVALERTPNRDDFATSARRTALLQAGGLHAA
jgi:hypothetical protein